MTSNISSIISVLWTAFLFFSTNFVALVEAEDIEQDMDMCSCSPTVFTFVIDLAGAFSVAEEEDCETNDIEDNPGIDSSGSVCSVLMLGGVNQPGEPVTEIVSVQFLEFDTSGDLTVINQDDTYADVSLGSGDRLKFTSISSMLDTSLSLEDQMSNPALVPGGASLILYGKTESGAVVGNIIQWLYDMNCGRDNDPVQTGDEIGWITVGTELGGAWPAFCPALPDGSPTISPRTKEPTLTPSAEPTQEPTFGGTSTVGGGTTSPSPTLMATSMSYDSSLSISTVTTTITANTKAGKGKASKVTKGAKAA